MFYILSLAAIFIIARAHYKNTEKKSQESILQSRQLQHQHLTEMTRIGQRAERYEAWLKQDPTVSKDDAHRAVINYILFGDVIQPYSGRRYRENADV